MQNSTKGYKSCDDGTKDIKNFTFEVKLDYAAYGSSGPKGHIYCTEGCIQDDPRSQADPPLYLTYMGSKLTIECDVLFPPCGILVPTWYKNDARYKTGETIEIANANLSHSGEYRCEMQSEIGKTEKKFTLDVVKKDVISKGISWKFYYD